MIYHVSIRATTIATCRFGRTTRAGGAWISVAREAFIRIQTGANSRCSAFNLLIFVGDAAHTILHLHLIMLPRPLRTIFYIYLLFVVTFCCCCWAIVDTNSYSYCNCIVVKTGVIDPFTVNRSYVVIKSYLLSRLSSISLVDDYHPCFIVVDSDRIARIPPSFVVV